MKKIILTLVAMIIVTGWLRAQTEVDALRYSRIDFNGTARFTGLSGAFGALGADFSVAAVNPAGIGFYRSSEMTLTFAPHLGNTSSEYNGTSASDSRGNFGMGNFGAIFSLDLNNQTNKSKVRNVNFGFGFNRQNDFNNRVMIRGLNMKNSLMQSYTNYLNDQAIPPSSLKYDYLYDLSLAYNANLVFFDSATNRYYCDAAYGGVMQEKHIETSGSVNELDFSCAANIGEKLFLGFTLGIPTINYYERSLFREYRVKDTVPNFQSLNYYYDLNTRGTGVNLKFGMIYKPMDWFRFGVAVHTPTWYPSMSDSWSASMESVFDSAKWNSTVTSPLGYIDYRMTTPFRAIGSIAFIVGQNGVVSADYEYVNYSQARYYASSVSFSDINNSIRDSYQSFGNFRVGTEWRYQSLRIRGGAAYFSNPYKGSYNNMERIQFSAGIGYRARSFFADFTYVFSKMKQSYYLYEPSMVNPASLNVYNHAFNTTVGVRF